MLRERDGTFGFKAHGWPLPPGNQQPGQPAHIESEVVQLAQEDVGADRALTNGGEEVLRAGLDEDPGPEVRQGLVADGGSPAELVGAALGGHDLLNGLASSACGGTGIAARQVGPAMCKLSAGWRSAWFLARTICRASASLAVPRLVRRPVSPSTQ